MGHSYVALFPMNTALWVIMPLLPHMLEVAAIETGYIVDGVIHFSLQSCYRNVISMHVEEPFSFIKIAFYIVSEEQ